MNDSSMKLKSAMIGLLENKSFECITVAEICRKADVSRMTFYSHYDDKYELLDDYFKDMLDTATSDFDNLQKANNPEELLESSYCNLLDAILNLYYSHLDFFRHTEREGDRYLYWYYYSQVLEKIEKFTIKYCTFKKPLFSTEKTSALLCNALWGYIHTSRNSHEPLEATRKGAKEALRVLLASGLFV